MKGATRGASNRTEEGRVVFVGLLVVSLGPFLEVEVDDPGPEPDPDPDPGPDEDKPGPEGEEKEAESGNKSKMNNQSSMMICLVARSPGFFSEKRSFDNSVKGVGKWVFNAVFPICVLSTVFHVSTRTAIQGQGKHLCGLED